MQRPTYSGLDELLYIVVADASAQSHPRTPFKNYGSLKAPTEESQIEKVKEGVDICLQYLLIDL